ncbi:MAG: helix-turn-helix domain-containing protein [Gammaproteobacteria bacterium]
MGGAELSHLISAAHLSWRFDPAQTRRLEASLALRSLGALRLARVRVADWSGQRSGREICANPEPYLTFLMPLRGSILLAAEARSQHVGKHELGIWDSTRPMSFEIGRVDFEMLSVLVPQRLLRASRSDCAGQHCARIGRDNVLSELCVRHMTTLARFLDDELRPYELTISDLTTSMFDALLAGERGGLRDRHRLLADIKEYIECYIIEDTLSAATIANAFDITPRYVHKLFEPGGCTVREWILRRRVERSTADLEHSRDSITTIAYKWGFKDLGHYSRVFRRVFGQPPSAWREKRNEPVEHLFRVARNGS